MKYPTRTESILYGIGAAVIVVGIIAFFWNPKPKPDEQIGAGREIQRIYDTVYKAAETRFRTDTVKLTKWLTRYDTVYTVQRITDTVWVKEYIRVSDSTIRACTETVSSCTAAKNALLEINRGLRLELEGERRKRPSRLRTTVERVATFSLGYGVRTLQDAVTHPP